jgi:hypothetical protein
MADPDRRATSRQELGPAIAYTGLQPGTPVYDRGSDRIGVVAHVLADEAQDIFHGLVIRTGPLAGRHLVALADQIDTLYEQGVLLCVDGNELHDPSTAPGTRTSAAAWGESPLEAALRHAWDWLNEPR